MLDQISVVCGSACKRPPPGFFGLNLWGQSWAAARWDLGRGPGLSPRPRLRVLLLRGPLPGGGLAGRPRRGLRLAGDVPHVHLRRVGVGVLALHPVGVDLAGDSGVVQNGAQGLSHRAVRLAESVARRDEQRVLRDAAVLVERHRRVLRRTGDQVHRADLVRPRARRGHVGLREDAQGVLLPAPRLLPRCLRHLWPLSCRAVLPPTPQYSHTGGRLTKESKRKRKKDYWSQTIDNLIPIW